MLDMKKGSFATSIEQSILQIFKKNRDIFFKLLKFTTNQYDICSEAKFIFTDVIQTRFEQFVRGNYNCSRTPYSARILSGKLKKPKILKFFKLSRHLYFFGFFGLSPKFDLNVKLATLRLWLLENRDVKPVTFQCFRMLYHILNSLRILIN